MSPKIMLYDYLNLNDLDIQLSPSNEPGKDDISFLIQVAQQIPKTQQEIDNLEAGQLASYCLAAFQRTVELLTKATTWSGYKKIALDAKYGSLINESTLPVTVKKEIAKSDPEYQSLAKEHEKAKAYVEFYTGVMSSFEKGHYWAKSREQVNGSENKMSGYESHEIKSNYKGGNLEQGQSAGNSVPGQIVVKNGDPVEDVTL